MAGKHPVPDAGCPEPGATADHEVEPRDRVEGTARVDTSPPGRDPADSATHRLDQGEPAGSARGGGNRFTTAVAVIVGLTVAFPAASPRAARRNRHDTTDRPYPPVEV